jgi:hypothetical protein
MEGTTVSPFLGRPANSASGKRKEAENGDLNNTTIVLPGRMTKFGHASRKFKWTQGTLFGLRVHIFCNLRFVSEGA